MSVDKSAMFFYSRWIKNTSDFRNLLNTSKGRDKFCQLLQYMSNFYATCMRESPVWGKQVKDKKNFSVLKAKKLEGSLSNGRKMFRLFLFMNEMAELNELIKGKKFEGKVRVVKIISTICSFIYYLTDNIIYLANLDFLPSTVPGFKNVKWK